MAVILAVMVCACAFSASSSFVQDRLGLTQGVSSWLLVSGLGLYKIPLLGIDLEGSWLAMYLFGFVTIAPAVARVMNEENRPVPCISGHAT